MTTEYLVLARAVHFGACLLFFGIFAFDRLVAASILESGSVEAARYWRSRIRFLGLALLPIILISGFAWFVLVATTMSSKPPQFEILKTVWLQTQFGTVWKIRLFVWVAALAAIAFLMFSRGEGPFQKSLIWLLFLFGGVLLGSLAWAGHGREDSHWHLFADVLHLLTAGFWPTGLLPFAMLLRQLRQTTEPAVVPLVRRFSALSLASVSMLTVTGLVNAWFLVGSFSNLFDQTYGRWLMVKVVLFGIAVSIGAVNLLRLKPRMTIENFRSPASQSAVVQLQSNVQAELVLGTALVIIVAILGILPP